MSVLKTVLIVTGVLAGAVVLYLAYIFTALTGWFSVVEVYVTNTLSQEKVMETFSCGSIAVAHVYEKEKKLGRNALSGYATLDDTGIYNKVRIITNKGEATIAISQLLLSSNPSVRLYDVYSQRSRLWEKDYEPWETSLYFTDAERATVFGVNDPMAPRQSIRRQPDERESRSVSIPARSLEENINATSVFVKFEKEFMTTREYADLASCTAFTTLAKELWGEYRAEVPSNVYFYQ